MSVEVSCNRRAGFVPRQEAVIKEIKAVRRTTLAGAADDGSIDAASAAIVVGGRLENHRP